MLHAQYYRLISGVRGTRYFYNMIYFIFIKQYISTGLSEVVKFSEGKIGHREHGYRFLKAYLLVKYFKWHKKLYVSGVEYRDGMTLV